MDLVLLLRSWIIILISPIFPMTLHEVHMYIYQYFFSSHSDNRKIYSSRHEIAEIDILHVIRKLWYYTISGFLYLLQQHTRKILTVRLQIYNDGILRCCKLNVFAPCGRYTKQTWDLRKKFNSPSTWRVFFFFLFVSEIKRFLTSPYSMVGGS